MNNKTQMVFEKWFKSEYGNDTTIKEFAYAGWQAGRRAGLTEAKKVADSYPPVCGSLPGKDIAEAITNLGSE